MLEATARFTLETERVILRDWREEDFESLHALCTCPQVMATIGALHDEEKTRNLLDRLRKRQTREGSTFWAMERKADIRVIGFCGIALGTVPFLADKLEIGWRLAADCWGQSYAREAAQASLEWARHEHPGETIWAITSVANSRSRGLMERLGMRYCPDLNFDHPGLAEDSPLSPHVTYRLDLAG